MAKKKNKSGGNGGSKPMSDTRFLMEKARTLPIYKCYVSNHWEKTGLAEVIVARERGNGNLCVGMFLCDVWCLGVKDAFGFVNMPKDEFKERIINRDAGHLSECDYDVAHNLIYGAEAFAADIDIEPSPAFDLWSNVLEEDTDDVPLIEMEFGYEGKYHLVAYIGSKEALQLDRLRKRLGEDLEFTLLDPDGMPIDNDYFEDDDFEDDDFEDDDFEDDNFEEHDFEDDND